MVHVFYIRRLRDAEDVNGQNLNPDQYHHVVTLGPDVLAAAPGLDMRDRAHRAMNAVDGDDFEQPKKLNLRSMSVGDVLIDEDGKGWLCAPAGWDEVGDVATRELAGKVRPS